MPNLREKRSRPGFVLTALSVLVPMVIFFLNLYLSQRTKEISIGIVARSPLVARGETDLSDFELIFQGKKVERVESLTLQFENSGDISIEREDFDGDIVAEFGEKARVLSASLSEAAPASLNPSFFSDPNTLFLRPLLLNPGDRFSLSLLISGQPSEPKIRARISGIRRVSLLGPKPDKTFLRAFISGVAGFVALFLHFYLMGFFFQGFSKDIKFSSMLKWIPLGHAASVPSIVLLVLSAGYLEISGLQSLLILLGMIVLCSPGIFVGIRHRYRLYCSFVDDISSQAETEGDTGHYDLTKGGTPPVDN